MDDDRFGISDLFIFPSPYLGFETSFLDTAHETYHIYVNDEFIGDKIFVNQNENLFDLQNYLKDQGFKEFDVNLEGDQFMIELTDFEQSHRMKDILDGYLHNR